VSLIGETPGKMIAVEILGERQKIYSFYLLLQGRGGIMSGF
jgi:hypothetical protein